MRRDPAVLAAAGRAARADRVRAAADAPRHVVGREARPRPRVPRRPLRRPVPADAVRDGRADRQARSCARSRRRCAAARRPDMCGIAGLVALDGRRSTPRGLEAMSRALVHRGPDDAGPGGRGAGRAGRPPAVDHRPRARPPADPHEDGRVVVVQNGEIFNHDELAAELQRARAHRSPRAATPRSSSTPTRSSARRSSSACAACSRSRCGTRASAGCCSRATAFGIKPLLWRVAGGVLSFASELTALREQPGFREELDPDALEAYFATNSIPSPLSIYRGVRKLAAGTPPGVAAGQRAGGPSLDAARAGRRGRRAPRGPGAARRRAARASCATASPRTWSSDVPVGVFLSGGIDSGALAALAAEQVTEPLRDVLGRLRGADVRRARRRTRGRDADRREPPRDRPARRRRGGAAAARRRRLRRAVRRLVDAPDLRRVRAGGRPRQGRAVGRGRRRAVRRLPDLRGRAARATVRPAGARAAAADRARAQLVAARQPRLQGAALRSRRGARPRRAPARLQGDPHAGRARRAPRQRRRAPTRWTACAHAGPRPRAPSTWPGSRTSTRASTSPTTC